MTEDTSLYRKPISSGILAWVAYDFINSLLIINGSLYFSTWITQEQGVSSFWYGFTYSISTVLLLVLLPYMGVNIDRKHNGQLWLLGISLLIGCLAISLPPLGHRQEAVWRLVGTLVVFGFITLLYQASLVAYNWLLVYLRGVNSSDDVRRVSGYGEASGSFGSVIGALLGAVILNWLRKDPTHTSIDLYLPLSIIFLALFIIDYLILSQGLKLRRHEINALPESNKELLLVSLGLLRKPGKLQQFLLAFLLYADALLTVQLYLPIYMKERLSLDDATRALAFAISLTAGVLGALLFAKVTRRAALKRIIVYCLWGWTITLFSLGLVNSKSLFFMIIIIAGILYGVLWSASRAYLIELTQPELLGRTFGFYAVFERCASIIGPLLWGGVMLIPFSLPWRYFCAFTAMSLLVVLGALILLFWDRKATTNKESSLSTA